MWFAKLLSPTKTWSSSAPNGAIVYENPLDNLPQNQKHGSFTDDRQIQRFCDYLDIPCEEVKDHPLFNYDRLEAIYRTTEHTFDPFLMRNYYKQSLEEEKNITIKLKMTC